MNKEKIPASQWQSMQVTEEHLTFKFNQHLHKSHLQTQNSQDKKTRNGNKITEMWLKGISVMVDHAICLRHRAYD
jgi:hypothetical protein